MLEQAECAISGQCIRVIGAKPRVDLELAKVVRKATKQGGSQPREVFSGKPERLAVQGFQALGGSFVLDDIPLEGFRVSLYLPRFLGKCRILKGLKFCI